MDRAVLNINIGKHSFQSIVVFLAPAGALYVMLHHYRSKNYRRNSGGTLQQKETKRKKEKERKREKRRKRREKERRERKGEKKREKREKEREKKDVPTMLLAEMLKTKEILSDMLKS